MLAINICHKTHASYLVAIGKVIFPLPLLVSHQRRLSLVKTQATARQVCVKVCATGLFLCSKRIGIGRAAFCKRVIKAGMKETGGAGM
jgi:hypothetical protein